MAHEQDDIKCSSVALLPHNLYSGSSLIFHVHRLVRVGNISYRELIAKRIFLVSILQSLFHGIVFARTDSHLRQLLCFLWATALVMRASSSPCRISSWTNSRRCCLNVELNLLQVMHPSPSHPCVKDPMMSLCLSRSSANFTASSILHFRPERSLIPAPLT